MIKTGLSAALAALVAGPALAGGLGEPAAPPVVAPPPVVVVPSADWTGFYVGGSVGTISISDDDDQTEDIDGNTYGLHAGYMFDLGSVVAGGEIDYAWATLEDDVAFDIDGEADVNILRFKGRLGFDAGSFLPYVTAGIATLTSDDNDIPDLEENGTVYGIGADFAVTPNILVGGEFLRHNFEDAEPSALEADTMSLRASFKF